jgi:hypothetical protein
MQVFTSEPGSREKEKMGLLFKNNKPFAKTEGVP